MIIPTKNKYRLSQGFGLNPEIYAQFGLKGHNGLDYATPVGTEIIAPEDGIVESGNDGAKSGYGLYVRIFTAKGEHVLAHLSRSVKTGNVKQGEIIGISGNTGFSTGPHLHWGYRERDGVKGNVKNYGNGFLGYVDQTNLIKENDMKHIQSYKFSNKETVYGLYAYDTMEEVVGNIVTYSRPSLVKDSDNPEISLKYGIPTFESVSYLGIGDKDIEIDSDREKIKALESEKENLKKKNQVQSLEIEVLKERIEELGSNPNTVPVYETKEEEQVHGFITKTIEFIRNLLK